MIPIDKQVSWSKVKFKGQAYASHVGEGGHLRFTNSYILVSNTYRNTFFRIALCIVFYPVFPLISNLSKFNTLSLEIHCY